MDLKEINITDKKIKQFESKGISTVEDLLRYFPRKYIDFRELKSLDTAAMDEENLFSGVIQRVGNGRGGVVFCDILEFLGLIKNGYTRRFRICRVKMYM